MKIKLWKEVLLVFAIMVVNVFAATAVLDAMAERDDGKVLGGLLGLGFYLAANVWMGGRLARRWGLLSEDPIPLPKENRKGLPPQYVDESWRPTWPRG